MAILYQTNLTDQGTCQINKYIKKTITVGNWHIWKGQQLTGYGIFEFVHSPLVLQICRFLLIWAVSKDRTQSRHEVYCDTDGTCTELYLLLYNHYVCTLSHDAHKV
jgi:hypothetical protein